MALPAALQEPQEVWPALDDPAVLRLAQSRAERGVGEGFQYQVDGKARRTGAHQLPSWARGAAADPASPLPSSRVGRVGVLRRARAATTLQSWQRGVRVRRALRALHGSARLIQRRYRRYLLAHRPALTRRARRVERAKQRSGLFSAPPVASPAPVAEVEEEPAPAPVADAPTVPEVDDDPTPAPDQPDLALALFSASLRFDAATRIQMCARRKCQRLLTVRRRGARLALQRVARGFLSRRRTRALRARHSVANMEPVDGTPAGQTGWYRVPPDSDLLLFVTVSADEGERRRVGPVRRGELAALRARAERLGRALALPGTREGRTGWYLSAAGDTHFQRRDVKLQAGKAVLDGRTVLVESWVAAADVLRIVVFDYRSAVTVRAECPRGLITAPLAASARSAERLRQRLAGMRLEMDPAGGDFPVALRLRAPYPPAPSRPSSRPKQHLAASRLQALARMLRARREVHELRCALASDQQVCVALPGTLQGTPGWYALPEGEEQVAYVSVVGDAWELWVGPISQPELRDLCQRALAARPRLVACPGTPEGQTGYYCDHHMAVRCLRVDMWTGARSPFGGSPQEAAALRERDRRCVTGVTRMQAVVRAMRAKRQLHQALVKLATQQGMKPAMPGTTQGRTGWYRERFVPCASYYQLLPDGLWGLLVGPMPIAHLDASAQLATARGRPVAMPGTRAGYSGLYMDAQRHVRWYDRAPSSLSVGETMLLGV